MKLPVIAVYSFKSNFKRYVLLGISALFTYSSIYGMAANSAPEHENFLHKNQDTIISAVIQEQIASSKKTLYYPASVERFYEKSGYKLLWIAPDTVRTHASEAMLVLDCVIQYGLTPSDYHPTELLYEKLNMLTQHFNNVKNTEKARFDIMLTDAVIALMNNLHYGKLNPEYPAGKIDSGNTNGFSAETVLAGAIKQKNNFMEALLNVQPKSKEYTDMQYHLHLLAGLYTGDCYEVPEGDLRKIAINLERLRWINNNDQTYIQINIPSYSLKFHQPDTIYQFKVVAGTPSNPTPTLQSTISYFTTVPERKVPYKIFVKKLLPKAKKNPAYIENNHFSIVDNKGNYVETNAANIAMVQEAPARYSAWQSSGCDNSIGLTVFRFPNIYDIYLHDTSETQLFRKQQKAYSHGCIHMEHAANFAELLLRNDGAADKIAGLLNSLRKYQPKNFILKKAVPIKITYLTCEVKEGIFITYNDIYNLDMGLEAAMFNVDQPFAVQ